MLFAVNSQPALAGQYQSEIEFPYIYASGEVHKVHVPFYELPPNGIKVKQVSWSWAPRLQRYNVKICQMVTNICKDVSNEYSGVTTIFSRGDAALPYYFLVTSVGRPFNPEWGDKGGIDGRVVT